MNEKEVLQTIRNCEKLFVIFSRITNKAYLEKDELDGKIRVTCFVSEEKAVEKAKDMASQQIPAMAIRVEKKEKLQVLNDLYLQGVDEIIFCLEETHYIELKKIIRTPDYSRLPENQRPLENQVLQATLCRYLQVARNAATVGSEEVKKLDKELVELLPTAKYLLPFKASDEVNENGEKKLHLIVAQDNQGNKRIPVFTDNGEYQRFAKGEKYTVVIMSLEQLSQFKMPNEIDEFSINPGSCNLPVKQSLMAQMLYTVTWNV